MAEKVFNAHEGKCTCKQYVFQIIKSDMVLGAILRGLDELNLENAVDFILTSDHGMTSCDVNKTVSLASFSLFKLVS